MAIAMMVEICLYDICIVYPIVLGVCVNHWPKSDKEGAFKCSKKYQKCRGTFRKKSILSYQVWILWHTFFEVHFRYFRNTSLALVKQDVSPSVTHQAFFWPFQKNSSQKKLKDSKKTQANFPKTQESANNDDRIPPNI